MRLRPPRRSVAVVLLVACALGALLPAAFGRVLSQPSVQRSALAASSHVAGAPDRKMLLSRVVVQPGAVLSLHRHRGTQISRVVSGTLTYSVRRGSAVVREGNAESSPRLVRRIQAGQTARIRAGQWLVEQPSDIHHAANQGPSPVVIYLATLLEAGAPPSTPVTLP